MIFGTIFVVGMLALLALASRAKADMVRPLPPSAESKYDMMHYDSNTGRYLIVNMKNGKVKHGQRADQRQDCHSRA
jgi:hypothetical protein